MTISYNTIFGNFVWVSFLKMFISIMDSKKASGATNASFNYEKVTEMLAPHKTLKEIKKLKK